MELKDIQKQFQTLIKDCNHIVLDRDIINEDTLQKVADGLNAKYVYIHIRESESLNDLLYDIFSTICECASDSEITETYNRFESAYFNKQVDNVLVMLTYKNICKRLNEKGLSIIYLTPFKEVVRHRDFLDVLKGNRINKTTRSIVWVMMGENKSVAIKETFYPFEYLQSNQSDMNEIVWISYSWREPSNHIVHNGIIEALKTNDIDYMVDKRDCHYRDNIKKFEENIARTKRIVAVLTESYFYSPNCMYELARTFEEGNIQERLFIVNATNNLPFYKTENFDKILKHWKDELAKEEEKLANSPEEGRLVHENEIKIYQLIINKLAEIWGSLNNGNNLNLTNLAKDNWAELIKAMGYEVKDTPFIDGTLNVTSGATAPNVTVNMSGPDAKNFNFNGNGPVTLSF